MREELGDRVCLMVRRYGQLLLGLFYAFVLRGGNRLVLVLDEVGLRSRLGVGWHLKGAHLFIKHLNLN